MVEKRPLPSSFRTIDRLSIQRGLYSGQQHRNEAECSPLEHVYFNALLRSRLRCSDHQKAPMSVHHVRWIPTLLSACLGMGSLSQGIAGDPSAKEFLQTPLAKSAPRELKGLIESGKVTIKFVPATELPAEEWGRCDFSLGFRRDFQFDAEAKQKGGKRLAIVKVTSMKSDIRVVHRIRLREAFAPPLTWESPVTWHEFDHVAIGCDPRPALLLTYLADHLPTIERPIIRREEAMLSTLAGEWINEELTRRETAVTELIRQNNRLLDVTSGHGTEKIRDRREFFAKLYTKEHLAELKFPFLDEALGVFHQEAYRRAEDSRLDQVPTQP